MRTTKKMSNEPMCGVKTDKYEKLGMDMGIIKDSDIIDMCGRWSPERDYRKEEINNLKDKILYLSKVIADQKMMLEERENLIVTLRETNSSRESMIYRLKKRLDMLESIIDRLTDDDKKGTK